MANGSEKRRSKACLCFRLAEPDTNGGESGQGHRTERALTREEACLLKLGTSDPAQPVSWCHRQGIVLSHDGESTATPWWRRGSLDRCAIVWNATSGSPQRPATWRR